MWKSENNRIVFICIIKMYDRMGRHKICISCVKRMKQMAVDWEIVIYAYCRYLNKLRIKDE